MNQKPLLTFIFCISAFLSACGGSSSSDSSNDTSPIDNSNTAPIANAGDDLSITLNQRVTLSGVNSSDPDGDALTFQWSINSKPATSNLTLSNDNQSEITLTPDVVGHYEISLVVNDGQLSSPADTVIITVEEVVAQNNPPTANAGQDISALLSQSITLSGSNSTDPEGDALTFLWTLVTKPAGSTLNLTNTDLPQLTFMPDIVGDYELSLIVNDGEFDSSPDLIVVTIENSSSNTTPVANAGSDITIPLEQSVTLSGSNSSDVDGDELSFLWTLTNKPNDSALNLTNVNSVNITFTPDIIGTYQLSLVVNDGEQDSDADNVTVTVLSNTSNSAPIANAGNDTSIDLQQSVTLSGNNSSDPEGDALTFMWTIQSKPNDSLLVIENPTLSQITLTPDTHGEFEMSLIVNDGTLSSPSDTVRVTVQNQNIDITNQIFKNLSGNCSNYVGSYLSNVTDIKRAADFSGDIVITDDATKCYITANAIPNHNFNDQSASFATNVSEQNHQFSIPKQPTIAVLAQALNIGTTEAILLNGVTLDLLAAACYGIGNEPLGREKIGCGGDQQDNPWRYDPMSPINSFGTDANNAHTQPNGKYHYHGNPLAMFTQSCSDEPSAVIGFAADGYPIYGSCFKDPLTNQVRKATSSYVLKNNGGTRQDESGYQTPVAGVGEIASSNYDGQFRGDYEYVLGQGDLDECNGMTIDGQYGYYVIDAFPWVINCFKGDVDSSFGINNGINQYRMHRHD